MAISKLSIPQYVDGVTKIEAEHLNAIVSTINQLVEAANGSSSGGGTTPTAPSAPTITINGTSATISAVSGATIKYTTDGSTPSASVGNTYSGAITLSASCTIKAVAIKDGLVSSVATKVYTAPTASVDADAQTILNRYSKNLTSAKINAFSDFVTQLKASGVYEKIDYMVLPILANDVDEAVINALDGSNFLSNPESLELTGNGIKPIIGKDISQTPKIPSNGGDIHLSFFSINSAELISGKWDMAFSSGININCFGKQINTGVGCQFYGSVNGSNRRWSPTSLSGYKDSALTHAIITGDTSRILISVNGVQESYTTEVIGSPTANTNYAFGQYNKYPIYQETSSESTSFGGASAFRYGLLTIGRALTDTQCETFNNEVAKLMDIMLG